MKIERIEIYPLLASPDRSGLGIEMDEQALNRFLQGEVIVVSEGGGSAYGR